MKTLFVLCGALLAVAASAQVQFNTFSDVAFVGSLNQAAAGGYTASATTFAGDGQCWMERDGALTGAADGLKGALSFWVDFSAGDSTYQRIFQAPDDHIQVIRWNDNKLRVQITDAAGTVKVQFRSTDDIYIAAGGWFWVAAAWDNTTAGSAARFYINGADKLESVNYVQDSADLDYTVADLSVGDYIDGNNFPLQGCLSEFWLNTTNYVDWSDAPTRAKFYAAGKPVNLGADGTTPGFGQPIIYFKDSYSTFTANSGYGGNFVKKGTTAFSTCTAP